MSESAYRFRPIAVQVIPKKPVHVPDNIIIIDTVLDKLANSGDNLVSAGDLLKQKTHAATLRQKQEAMSMGAPDRREVRNKSYGVCFNDHRINVILVQLAANKIQDYNEAASLIKRNGYGIKKEHAPLSNPDIIIKRKENAKGTIIAKVKAPDTERKYAIEWDYSYDKGLTWNHYYPTPVCKRTMSGLVQHNYLTVRARFIFGDDPPLDWLISNTITI
jgi:hypothetical protein